MNIYEDYLKTIKSAMSSGNKRALSKSLSYTGAMNQEHSQVNLAHLRIPGETLQPNLRSFATQLGLRINTNQKLGAHPDFEYLKGTSNIENHYIVSVFIDIKGSTNLFKEYSDDAVIIINDTIQKAAIHTCLIFQGYVHRLQGDGLFVYFGGKNVELSVAVKRALQASSVFSYFVKNDLKKLFDQEGIKNIHTRIGIDLGYENQVKWYSAGVGEICEVTTSSIHTNLAPKMQSNAEDDGIVIGDHVKDNCEEDNDLITPVFKRTGRWKDQYIFQDSDKGLKYGQYDLNWIRYLKRQDFVVTDLDGNLFLKKAPDHNYSINHIKPVAERSTPYFHCHKNE